MAALPLCREVGFLWRRRVPSEALWCRRTSPSSWWGSGTTLRDEHRLCAVRMSEGLTCALGISQRCLLAPHKGRTQRARTVHLARSVCPGCILHAAPPVRAGLSDGGRRGQRPCCSCGCGSVVTALQAQDGRQESPPGPEPSPPSKQAAPSALPSERRGLSSKASAGESLTSSAALKGLTASENTRGLKAAALT